MSFIISNSYKKEGWFLTASTFVWGVRVCEREVKKARGMKERERGGEKKNISPDAGDDDAVEWWRWWLWKKSTSKNISMQRKRSRERRSGSWGERKRKEMRVARRKERKRHAVTVTTGYSVDEVKLCTHTLGTPRKGRIGGRRKKKKKLLMVSSSPTHTHLIPFYSLPLARFSFLSPSAFFPGTQMRRGERVKSARIH